jgi:hypothetical protein
MRDVRAAGSRGAAGGLSLMIDGKVSARRSMVPQSGQRRENVAQGVQWPAARR